MAEVMPAGSGGPIRPTPAVEGKMEIRGGVGGITFQFEELMGGAEKLDDLAEELAAVELEIQRVGNGLRPHQFGQWPSASRAAFSVDEAMRSVQVVREELQEISSQVRASKRDYETVEALINICADMGIPSLKDFEHVRMDVLPSPDLRGADLVLRNVYRARHEIVGILEGLIPALKPRPVIADREETLPIDFDGSPAALLARARLIDERGKGFVEVIQVDNGGQAAYVVVIPGTQAGGEVGGTNPFDEAGIVEGLGHGSAEINAAVTRALRSAGAEKGAPIVAVGYSQGGIHAMNLAADELFRSEYEMKYVLTAGSPVGGIVPAEGTSTLHLEHLQDWVPGGDGTPSPDTRNRVTVTLTDQVQTPEGEEPGLGPGHRLSNYEEAARLAAASGNASLVASTAVLGGVLGAGGTATATRFALSRTKPPETQGAAGPGRVPVPQHSPPPPSDRPVTSGQAREPVQPRRR